MFDFTLSTVTAAEKRGNASTFVKLPPELFLFTYELLSVATREQLNVKYQLLVDMEVKDYFALCRDLNYGFSKPYPFGQFTKRICFFPPWYFVKELQVEEQMIALGQLDVLKYLSAEGFIDFNNSNNRYVMLAVKACNYDVLMWLKDRGADFSRLPEAINLALELGQLDILQWVHQNNYEGWCEYPMDTAAEYGHLEIVMWLHEIRTEGCTTKAMDLAASNGHLNIVKYLHENRQEGCTTAAIDGAAKNGHLDLVKWFLANRKEGCTAKAMDNAARYGHLEVVMWFHQNGIEGCTKDAMDGAAENGHLDIVKWLHENRTEGCTTNAMDWAASLGHLDMVKWLHDNRTEGCTAKGLDSAAYFDRWDIVKWLLLNRTEGCTIKALNTAVYCDRLDIVQWFHENQSKLFTEDSIRYLLKTNPENKYEQRSKVIKYLQEVLKSL